MYVPPPLPNLSNCRHENATPRIVGLSETDVGITQFVGSSPGFTGVIKARFSDFQVNEIDQAGNVVRLTSTALPKPIVVGKCS